jgi:hypothetical protein
MLANILAILGGIVGLTALLDLFLSDAHKMSLSRAVFAVWNWLDDVKRLSFLDWLRNKEQVGFLSYASAGFSFFYIGGATFKLFHSHDASTVSLTGR